MRLLRTARGQSIAEYAILFAIVIGAAIAMQQYVKSRLQGAVQANADNYVNTIGNTLGLAVAPFEPVRTTTSDSGQIDNLNMATASTGNRTLDTQSNSRSTVTK